MPTDKANGYDLISEEIVTAPAEDTIDDDTDEDQTDGAE